MKWNIKLLTLTTLFIQLTTCCYAQIATQFEAIKVAQAHLGRDTNVMKNRVARVNTDYDSNGIPLLYEVIMNDSTMVLVSGSKYTSPILATYKSALGILETDNLPCGLSVLMNFYRESLSVIINNMVSSARNDEWQGLLNGENPESYRSSVGPLLTSKWGQSISNDSNIQYAYNKFTPPGNNCTHSLAGCVAVAMGQVMRFYQQPSVAYKVVNFSEQFDWCHMPDELHSSHVNSEHECDAVSRLLSICGDAVNMLYGCEGSGSTNREAKDALIYQFDYSPDARIISISHTIPWFVLDPFLDTIKMSLDRGYPVIMGAKEKNGGGDHTFVCDGYNGNKYHFNWGWLGQFDGLYSFNFWGNINIGNGHFIFSRNFDAIVFLHPQDNTANSLCDNELHLEDFYAEFYQYHNPLAYEPYDIIPKTMGVLYSADISSPFAWNTIPPLGAHKIVYRAYKEIVLQDGFTAQPGCDFTAEIDFCESCEGQRSIITEETGSCPAINEESTSSSNTGHSITRPHTSFHDLYPNPTSGELTMNVDGEVQSVVILNAMGQPVGGWSLLDKSGGSITLDVSPLATGTYLLNVTTTDGNTQVGRFIRR